MTHATITSFHHTVEPLITHTDRLRQDNMAYEGLWVKRELHTYASDTGHRSIGISGSHLMAVRTIDGGRFH
jgi:hypothetical protein